MFEASPLFVLIGILIISYQKSFGPQNPWKMKVVSPKMLGYNPEKWRKPWDFNGRFEASPPLSTPKDLFDARPAQISIFI